MSSPSRCMPASMRGASGPSVLAQATTRPTSATWSARQRWIFARDDEHVNLRGQVLDQKGEGLVDTPGIKHVVVVKHEDRRLGQRRDIVEQCWQQHLDGRSDRHADEEAADHVVQVLAAEPEHVGRLCARVVAVEIAVEELGVVREVVEAAAHGQQVDAEVGVGHRLQ